MKQHKAVYITLPIDIKPDIPTAKGNIYPAKLLDTALKEFFKEPQLITLSLRRSDNYTMLADAACISEKLIDKEGVTHILMKVLNNDQGDVVIDANGKGSLSCSIVGTGKTDDAGVIQEGYEVTGCVICRNDLPVPCKVRVSGGHTSKDSVRTHKLHLFIEEKLPMTLKVLPSLEVPEPIELPDFVKALRDYADELDKLLGKESNCNCDRCGCDKEINEDS